MSLSVTHPAVVVIPDDPNYPVGSDEWNAAHTVSITTALSPDSNDGAALGTTVVGWSDLFLATDAVINWNNGQFKITQDNANNRIIIAWLSLPPL